MWNDKITLIDYPEYSNDYSESLNDFDASVERTVFADVRSTTRNEFYNFGVSENRPQFVVRINRFEYNGELYCRYKNKIYSIVREYPIGTKYVELTLAPEIGGSIR